LIDAISSLGFEQILLKHIPTRNGLLIKYTPVSFRNKIESVQIYAVSSVEFMPRMVYSP